MTFALPEPVKLPYQALSISAHPSSPTLAIGLTTGGLLIAHCNQSSKPSLHPVEAAIPVTSFLDDHVLAASESTVLLFDASKPEPVSTFHLPKPAGDDAAHESSTGSCIYSVDNSLFLVGDDNGGIHFFDRRTPKPVTSILEQADYITCMQEESFAGTDALLVASGDGTLCAYDLRHPPKPRLRLQYATDTYNDDLLSMTRHKNLLIAGTLSGVLNLYNLGFMEKERESDAAEHVDRFYGHPECVNAVISHDDVVVTASSDGLIRVVDVEARQLIGVLEYDMPVDGRKRKKEAWPIEGMVRVSGVEKAMFALQGHDEFIRFCDASPLVDEDQGDDQQEKQRIQPVVEEQRKRKRGKRKGKFDAAKEANNFFDDL